MKYPFEKEKNSVHSLFKVGNIAFIRTLPGNRAFDIDAQDYFKWASYLISLKNNKNYNIYIPDIPKTKVVTLPNCDITTIPNWYGTYCGTTVFPFPDILTALKPSVYTHYFPISLIYAITETPNKTCLDLYLTISKDSVRELCLSINRIESKKAATFLLRNLVGYK